MSCSSSSSELFTELKDSKLCEANGIKSLNLINNLLTPQLNAPKSKVKKWYVFTESDKILLRKSWQPIFLNLETFGIEIYEMIFQQCPEARNLFPFMKDYTPGKVNKKHSTEFAFQALRFVQILESGINALDNLSSLDFLLNNLGRRHGKLDTTNIFRAYYWSVFLECAIHTLRKFISVKVRRSTGTLTNEAEIDRAIILWRRLLEGIIERIEAGFMTDIANRKSSIQQRGAVCPKWKYSGSTRAGWITASNFKSTESLIQNFYPFKSSDRCARSKSRELFKKK